MRDGVNGGTNRGREVRDEVNGGTNRVKEVSENESRGVWWGRKREGVSWGNRRIVMTMEESRLFGRERVIGGERGLERGSREKGLDGLLRVREGKSVKKGLDRVRRG